MLDVTLAWCNIHNAKDKSIQIKKKHILSNFLYLRFFFLSQFIPVDILPHNTVAGPETKEFLLKVVDVLLDYVKAQCDRKEPVLEFHHPEDMKRLLDLDVPDTALPLQQLIQDCATTMKYQVKTGKCLKFIN